LDSRGYFLDSSRSNSSNEAYRVAAHVKLKSLQTPLLQWTQNQSKQFTYGRYILDDRYGAGKCYFRIDHGPNNNQVTLSNETCVKGSFNQISIHIFQCEVIPKCKSIGFIPGGGLPGDYQEVVMALLPSGRILIQQRYYSNRPSGPTIDDYTIFADFEKP